MDTYVCPVSIAFTSSLSQVAVTLGYPSPFKSGSWGVGGYQKATDKVSDVLGNRQDKYH